MKTQCKRIRISLFSKGSLFASMLLFVCPVAAFAQGAEVCQGTGYTIADAVPASAGSEYRWLENGNVLANTNQAAYNVPDSKVAGVYTYVRQSKSADCPDWQSSNEFTLTVFACSFTAGTETGATATFTDPRDGKQYKTVVMPDGRTWFAQNLNYTKDLTFNMYASEANGKQYITWVNGVPAIGSYWCPGANNSVYEGDRNMCNIYGALYSWETVMMVDGKYADETKTSSAWDESWVSPYYYTEGAPGATANADKNNARGGHGICPMSWHIPTDREWAQMLDQVEGNTIYTVNQTGVGYWGTDAGIKLKSASTYTGTNPANGAWYDDVNRGTDVYGFRILPAGYQAASMIEYRSFGYAASLSSSSVANESLHYTRFFTHNHADVYRDYTHRLMGFSVRCIKD